MRYKKARRIRSSLSNDQGIIGLPAVLATTGPHPIVTNDVSITQGEEQMLQTIRSRSVYRATAVFKFRVG